MISVTTYLWRGSRDFLPVHVDALARQVAKHMATIPHRFICVTDYARRAFCELVEVVELPAVARALLKYRNPAGEKFPVSYPRLWTFSEDARALGETVMLIDADAMMIANPAPLLSMGADFVGWRVRPIPGKPRRFAGGTWLHRTGTRTYVWEKFIADPQAAIDAAAAAGYLGSDQAWISYNLSEREAEWPEPSGIYCAQDWRKTWDREHKRHRRMLERRKHLPPIMQRRPVPQMAPLTAPADAIILHMNGGNKPWHSDDAVVRKYWLPFFRANPC